MMHPTRTLLLAGALLGATPLLAQNTNDDAPKAQHTLAFPGGAEIAVSYQQLELAGGQSLKNLMAKGATGDQYRQFYNTQYLPEYLKGSLRVSQATSLGGHKLPAGSYRFTFRIDGELAWHFVVSDEQGKEVCALALEAAKDPKSMAKRLVVEPIATSEEAQGYLEIRYGPLQSKLAFAPAGDAPLEAKDAPKDAAPADAGKPAGKPGAKQGKG
jgi:hypothetical protein